MMTAFVTGATGFVGRHLVAALAGAAIRVLALRRGTNDGGLPPHLVTWVNGDLREPERYRSALGEAQVVFHLAALLQSRRVEEYHRVNVEGTKALLRACREGRAPRRVVMLSSIAAMGPRHDGLPLHEGDVCIPVSEYGKSKLAAEVEALSAADQIPLVILRPAFIHGSGDRRGPEHLRTILAGSPSDWRTPIRTLSFIHVDDVVGALAAASCSDVPSGSVYLVAEPRPYSWKDVGSALAGAVGDLVERGWLPRDSRSAEMRARFAALDAHLIRTPRPEDWACDTRATRRDLGFTASRTLRDGARDAILAYALRHDGSHGPGAVRVFQGRTG